MKIHFLLAVLLLKCANGDESESSSSEEEVSLRQKFEDYFPSIYSLHGIPHGLGVVRSGNILLRNGGTNRQDQEYQYPSKWKPPRPEFLKNYKNERKPRKPNSDESPEDDFQLPPKWKPPRPEFLQKKPKPEEIYEVEQMVQGQDDGEFHLPPKWRPPRPEFMKNYKKQKKPQRKPDSDESPEDDFQLPPKWKPPRPEFLQKKSKPEEKQKKPQRKPDSDESPEDDFQLPPKWKPPRPEFLQKKPKPEEVHEVEQEIQLEDDGEFHLPPKWRPPRPEFLKNREKRPRPKPVNEDPPDDFVLPPKWKPPRPAFLETRKSSNTRYTEIHAPNTPRFAPDLQTDNPFMDLPAWRSKPLQPRFQTNPSPVTGSPSTRSIIPEYDPSQRGAFDPWINKAPDYPFPAYPILRSEPHKPRWIELRPEFLHEYFRAFRPQVRPPPPAFLQNPREFHDYDYHDGYHTDVYKGNIEEAFRLPPNWGPPRPALLQPYDRMNSRRPTCSAPSYEHPPLRRPPRPYEHVRSSNHW
ncbi:unnamed protein product [Phyllotreta striolata]|uniref:Uncharacterized protein n=1 Tax=Phyllotreta striolata TaxID=444603 RepID=A0A9N9TX88_PHYSR|nr:unnamed protein product [Phyllotreta striolata]